MMAPPHTEHLGANFLGVEGNPGGCQAPGLEGTNSGSQRRRDKAGDGRDQREVEFGILGKERKRHSQGCQTGEAGTPMGRSHEEDGKGQPRHPETEAGDPADLWKSSMQWIWLVASTVKGMPSRPRWHTTQVKQPGW